jgi:sporulation protein YlmC with PRC-barrel domain
MQMRYYELVGKRVVTADGQRIGRVGDLFAEHADGRLRVTALIVGPSAWIRRIGFKRTKMLHTLPARSIPWRTVARIAKDIELCVDAASLVEIAREAPG